MENGIDTSSIPASNMQGETPKKDIKKFIPFIAIPIVIIAIIVCVSLFSGKTLKCTQEQTTMGMKINIELNAKIKGKTVEYVKAKAKYDLSGASMYKNADEELLNKAYDTMKDSISKSKGVKNVEGKRDGKNIEFTYDMDLDTFGGNKTNESYEDAKKALEKQGFTCE